MSSLDYTYEHIDEVISRDVFECPEIDVSKTALLVLDLQKLIVDPNGAAHVESVGGAPAGKDVVEPCMQVVEHCRKLGMPIIWSLWGLRGDGLDAGMCTLKWPFMNPGTPDSIATWGQRDAELDDACDPRDNEPQIYKSRFSTFYNTDFDSYLKDAGADTVVIAGVTTANCMHATAIDGWNRCYKIIGLADTSTSLPRPGDNPMGTGQHWEALRNIQMNYGDVRTSKEFFDMTS